MSIDPMRATARALAYWERRQEIASNNLANTETPGFKGQRVFAQLLDGAAPTAGVVDDMTAGVIRETGRPLDLAVEGAGFLVVETADGTALRRGGSLSLDESGTLVDSAGRAVLGAEGPIVLPPGEVEVGPGGEVTVDGEAVARLRVETAAADTLERIGDGLWQSGAREAAGEATVRQGALEGSNVETLDGLMEMLEVQRNYAAIQKGVITLDEVLETIANRIGRIR
jgi:flagellar basal body rod protein FlgG